MQRKEAGAVRCASKIARDADFYLAMEEGKGRKKRTRFDSAITILAGFWMGRKGRGGVEYKTTNPGGEGGKEFRRCLLSMERANHE